MVFYSVHKTHSSVKYHLYASAKVYNTIKTIWEKCIMKFLDSAQNKYGYSDYEIAQVQYLFITLASEISKLSLFAIIWTLQGKFTEYCRHMHFLQSYLNIEYHHWTQTTNKPDRNFCCYIFLLHSYVHHAPPSLTWESNG